MLIKLGLVGIFTFVLFAGCGQSSTSDSAVGNAVPISTPTAIVETAATATPTPISKPAPTATPVASSAATSASTPTAPPPPTATPVPGAWGTKVTTPMEILYATDVPDHVKVLHKEALDAAANEWGNYGPLEYWVAGTDVAAATELAEQWCSRRSTQRNYPSKDFCMNREHVARFLPAQAAEAAKAIEEDRVGGQAGLNGSRALGIHLLSSSYPLCFDDGVSRCAYQEDQGTVLHEYFHVVQHSHIFTRDRNERNDLLEGPGYGVWFNEGGAEFMAQSVTQRLREAGTLTASTWNSETRRTSRQDLATRMEWKMNQLQQVRRAHPTLDISKLEYGENQNWGYDFGSWAHAYLANIAGPDALVDSFYPNLNELGWEKSFAQTYGMSSAAFLDKFNEFLDLPFHEQSKILP